MTGSRVREVIQEDADMWLVSRIDLRHLIWAVPFVIGACVWCTHRPVTHGPGQIAPSAPVQQPADGVTRFGHGEFTVRPLAEFQLTARVLSRKNYSLGKDAKLCPVDLALGWGPMSDEAVLSDLSISQFDRCYMWSMRELSVPRVDVERNSANMHMIPSTPEIRKRLKSLRRGSLIECRGYLVEVTAPGGWHWRSSLTRNDVGQGACEVVWVEELEVL